MAQSNHESEIILCLDSDGACIGLFTFMELLGVFDVEQNVGVLGRGFGVEQPLPGIFEILGTNFFTVAPGNVVAQMKNQLSPAFDDIPRLGDHRSRFELLVKFRQPDHQVGNDVEGDMVRRQRPVETGRLGAEIDAESFPRDAAFRAGLAGGAKNSEMSANSRR